MIEKLEGKFTKYEVARILGARALQLSMDAPLLLKMSKEGLEKIQFNPLKIAEKELEAEILPITVKKPFPKKSEIELKTKKTKEEPKEEKIDDEKIEEVAEKEEEVIKEEGEIMELAQPADEREEENQEKSVEV